jgi:hypothetical protein
MIDPTKAILDWEQADQIMQDQRAEIARLRLTDEERDVLHGVANDAAYRGADYTERLVRQLLERLT